MNYLLCLGLSIITYSCSQTDEKFCVCIKTSDSLNRFSEKLLTGEKFSVSSFSEAKKLKDRKNKACAHYENMLGGEMLELKINCK
jgi:hypothetical protein